MSFYDNNRKNIERLIKLGAFDNKKIALWQIDGYSRDSISVFTSYGIKPDAILSFDGRLYEKKIWGIPVFEPFSWAITHKDDAVILMSSAEYSFHKNHLINAVGFKTYNIYINLRKHPCYFGAYIKTISNKIRYRIRESFIRINKSIFLFLRWIVGTVKLINGCRVYYKIRKEYGIDTEVLFVNFSGLGDAYLLSILFESYKEVAELTNYIFLTYSKSSGRIISLILKDAKIVNLSLKEKDVFERFFNVMLSEDDKMKKMVCLPDYKNIYTKKKKKKYTLFDTFARYIYGLNDNEIYLKRPVLTKNDEYAAKLFEKANLTKGNTIILAPNANSEPPVSYDIWGKIARLFIQAGFDVVSMCHGNEVPIKYTNKIDFPLEKAWEVVDYAGYYIGIRCGFTDLISETNCKKIILYPQSPFVPPEYLLCRHMNGATIFEHTSFANMNIGNNVLDIPIEYKYNTRLEKILLNYIMREKSRNDENTNIY